MMLLSTTTECAPKVVENDVSIIAQLVSDNGLYRFNTAFSVSLFGAAEKSAASNIVNGQTHRQEVIRFQHLKANRQRHV